MCKPSTRHARVSDKLIDALEAVLAEHWSLALFDYRASSGRSASERQNHIFLKLEVTRRWLDDIEENNDVP